MSASLVGSEMCIRDRVPRSTSSTGGETPCGPGKKRGPFTEGPQKALKPVSYTHLTLPTICSV
eukprot:14005667-Alexandrium_andersonii.AAC.1